MDVSCISGEIGGLGLEGGPQNLCVYAQGSPLSPVLHNIYTTTVTQITSRGPERILTIADDIFIYRTDAE